MIPKWDANKMSLSGDINIQTSKSGYYKDMIYSPNEYKVSAEVKNCDPCKTQSCDIWVSTLGLEEEKLGYYMGGEYVLFSEWLTWGYAYDLFEKELEEGFHVKLNNLEESAVSQTFSGKFGTDHISLDVFFDLVHTPQ